MPTPLRVQTDRAISLRIKEQLDPDVLQPDAPGVEDLRFASSSGFQFPRARIASRESRNDGKARRGRGGRGQCEFAVSNDFVIGAYNTLIAGVMRNSVVAATVFDQVDWGQASVAGGTGVVTFPGAATDPLADGVKRGHVHRYSAGLAAADLNVNLVVLAVTAASITYHKNLTANAAANFTATKIKNVIQSNQDIAYTGEERRDTLDESEMCRNLRWGSWTMSYSPDSNIDIAFTGMGLEKTRLMAANSPFYSAANITRAPGIGLVAPNAKFYIVGYGFLRLSAFNFSFNNQLSREDSVDVIPYEIIPGQPQISAQITTIETNLDLEDDYLNEAELEGFLLIEEPTGAAPKGCAAIWFESFTLNTPGKSGAGADRSSTRTYNIDPDVNEGGGDAANTNIVYSTSL